VRVNISRCKRTALLVVKVAKRAIRFVAMMIGDKYSSGQEIRAICYFGITDFSFRDLEDVLKQSSHFVSGQDFIWSCCIQTDTQLHIIPTLDDRGSRVRLPEGAGNFPLHHRFQNGLWGPPSLPSNECQRIFPWGKAAGAWSWPFTSI
jgi:hypothetical protein